MELDQIHTLKGQKMNKMDCSPYYSSGLDKKDLQSHILGNALKPCIIMHFNKIKNGKC